MKWRYLQRFGMVALAWALGLNAAFAQSSLSSVVDVLAVYTPEARIAAGGNQAIQSQIQGGVMEANLVLQNSRANARIRLVRATEITYEESGSVSNDLARLRSPSDGFMDEVHALREQCAADLVCLVTERGDDWWFYGLQGPSAANAFSVIRRPYLIGDWYLPVGLSFNFGCQLERGYSDSVGAFSYSYGYSFFDTTDTPYSTVEGFSWTRLPFFSSPNIEFNGVAAGVPAGMVDAADNVRVLNLTAPIVAAFRGPASRTLPPLVQLISPLNHEVFGGGTNILLQANIFDSDGSVARVDFFADGMAVGSTATAPFVFTWTNVSAATHELTAVGMDNLGAASVSIPVNIVVRPANDDFDGRILLKGTNVIARGLNSTATRETDEPEHNAANGSHSVWWHWTSPYDAVVRVSVAESTFPPVVSVYEGGSIAGLTSVRPSVVSESSGLEFRAEEGVDYAIAVDGGAPDQVGEIVLQLTSVLALGNDYFENRTMLTGDSLWVEASNADASREDGEPNHAGRTGTRSLWWTWTAPSHGKVALHIESYVDDWILAGIYRGNFLTNLTPVAEATFFSPEISFYVEGGATLQIAVDSWAHLPNPGPFSFQLQFAPKPTNDDFADRAILEGATVIVSNVVSGASVEPGEAFYCWGGVRPLNSLWWSWTAPASGVVTIGSEPETCVMVATGDSLANLNRIDTGATVSFEASIGTTYLIAAAGSGNTAVFTLSLSTVTITTPTNGAVVHQGEAIWVTATATTLDGTPTNGTLFVDGAIIGQTSIPPFSIQWSNPTPGTHTLKFATIDAEGIIRPSLPISVTVRPSNDDFSQRSILSGLWICITNSIVAATFEPGEPQHAGTGWRNSIWWSWTAPVSGTVTLSAPPNNLAVYIGGSVSNLTEVTNGRWTATFEAIAGTTYVIAEVGWDGDIPLKLSLSNVRITSPATGAMLTEGGDLPILASTGATGGDIQRVEFLTNGVLIGTATNSPYSIVWSNVPGGEYKLVAIAFDAEGRDRVSPPVLISVRPANDEFENAIVLGGEIAHLTGSTSGATKELGEPAHDGGNGGQSVWYTWTAPKSGRYSAILDTYGGLLAVYTGSTLSNLTLVCTNATWRNATFTAQSGTVYLIAIDNAVGVGSFTLDILPTPANDDFSESITITNVDALVVGNNLGASHEAGEEVYNYYGGQSVWWKWVAPRSGRLTFTTYASGLVPMLHIYTISLDSALTLLPGQTGGPWDDIDSLAFGVTEGTSYAILADDKWNPDWSISFHMNFTPRPGNDDFADRLSLTGTNIVLNGDNALATREAGEPHHAGSTEGRSVWYTWTTPIAGMLTTSVDGEGSQPILAIYNGTSLSNLATIVNTGATNAAFMAAKGGTYVIAVVDGAGPFNLWLNFVSAPPNDDFASRTALGGITAYVQGTSQYATREPNEPALVDWGIDGSIWYSWVAPVDGWTKVQCEPARPMGVYSGNTLSNLAEVAPASFGQLTFDATAGTEYQIEVTAGQGLSDEFTLQVQIAKAKIISPTNEALFANGDNILVSAETLEIGDPVQQVDFYVGTNWLAMSTNRPFSIIWSNVPAGHYQVYAAATDETGGVTISKPVGIRIRPDNDDFGNRIAVSGVDVSVIADNGGATMEPNEPLLPGGSGRTMWWTWTAPGNGMLTVKANTNGFINVNDAALGGTPLIALYEGVSFTNLSLLATNPSYFTKVSVSVHGGQSYIISRDGWNQSDGWTVLNFTFEPIPSNDDFNNRSVFNGYSLAFTNSIACATHESNEIVLASGTGKTLWWSWIAPANGIAVISTELVPDGPPHPPPPPPPPWPYLTAQNVIIIWPGWEPAPPGSASGPLIAVYTGDSLTSLSLIGSNSFYYNGSSWPRRSPGWRVLESLSFNAVAGCAYQIAMDGCNGSTAPAPLKLNLVCAPANDNFSNPICLSGSSLTATGTLAAATRELTEPDHGSEGWPGTAWWSWTAPSSGVASLDVVSSVGVPMLGVYAGSVLPSLVPITQGSGAVTFYAVAGTTYQLAVAGPNGLGNDYTLSINGPLAVPELNHAGGFQTNNGCFQLRITGVLGQGFAVQASTNLFNWETILVDTILSDIANLVDGDAAQFPHRFYRVLPLEAVTSPSHLSLGVTAKRGDGAVGVRVFGPAGQPFRLRASSNLVDWEEVQRGFIIGEFIEFVDQEAGSRPARFYEAVPVP